jgi:hypothetical protein
MDISHSPIILKCKNCGNGLRWAEPKLILEMKETCEEIFSPLDIVKYFNAEDKEEMTTYRRVRYYYGHVCKKCGWKEKWALISDHEKRKLGCGKE